MTRYYCYFGSCSRSFLRPGNLKRHLYKCHKVESVSSAPRYNQGKGMNGVKNQQAIALRRPMDVPSQKSIGGVSSISPEPNNQSMIIQPQGWVSSCDSSPRSTTIEYTSADMELADKSKNEHVKKKCQVLKPKLARLSKHAAKKLTVIAPERVPGLAGALTVEDIASLILLQDFGSGISQCVGENRLILLSLMSQNARRTAYARYCTLHEDDSTIHFPSSHS